LPLPAFVNNSRMAAEGLNGRLSAAAQT
jgi:hypothetical protein